MLAHSSLRFFFLTVSVVALAWAVGVTEAIHGPSPLKAGAASSSPSSCTAGVGAPTTTKSCTSSASNGPPSVFGIVQHLPALVALRGGQILEPETLADVQAILLKAGADQKLVCLNFSAHWCGPCKMIAPLVSRVVGVLDAHRGGGRRFSLSRSLSSLNLYSYSLAFVLSTIVNQLHQVKELSEAMTDVVFIKVDVDENPDTAAHYNVSAMVRVGCQTAYSLSRSCSRY
jgi:thiol-disulfide isomerase/thioredoxin